MYFLISVHGIEAFINTPLNDKFGDGQRDVTHTAEDIKGVEVNSTAKNVMSYVMRFYPYSPPGTFAFIEITTRPGHGPNSDNTPGVYLYKPVALNWPKEFYKPKYAVAGTGKQASVFRPTVDWEPNIITNENGEAEVSFFPSYPHYNYTVTINGCDDAGNLGACTTVIRKKK